MLRILFPLFLPVSFLSFAFGVHGQSPTGSSPYLRAYRQAEKLYSSENATPKTDTLALSGYRQAIAFLTKAPVDDTVLFDSYLKSGILEMSGGHDREAIAFLHQAIRVRSARLPDSLAFKPYLYTGSSYYDLYDLDSALYFYKLAEKVLDAHPGLSDAERLYNKSGALYYETGDYRRSIQYFNKALAMVENRRPSTPYFIVNYKNNIATSLRKLQQYDQAIENYKSLLPYHINQNEILHNIGATYLDAGQPRQAIQFLNQVGYNDQVKYNHLAAAWLQLKNYPSAAENLRLALGGNKKKRPGQKSQDVSITLKILGDLSMAENAPRQALTYYQQAIIQLDRDFNDTSMEANPSTYYGLHNSFLLFDEIVAKANAFQAMGHGANPTGTDADRATLTNAFSAYASALGLARRVERMYNSDEAKLFLLKKVDAAYKQAVDLGFHLYTLTKDRVWLEKIFGYMEENKSSVLQADLGSPDPALVGDATRKLLQEEKSLQTAITALNIRLAATTDSQALNQIRDHMRDLEIRISGLQERLDESPEYAKLKFNNRSIGIAELQKNSLQDGAALLSYYYSTDSLYCFYITSDQYGCLAGPRPPGLKENILALRKELDGGEAAGDSRIGEMTQWLSGQLIGPVYEKIKNQRRLIVIPYNEIGYIPFEMLKAPRSNQLLLHDFAISYDYSANFLTNAGAPVRKTYNALAMAPFAKHPRKTHPGEFPALQSSAWEISGLNGRILLDRDATKRRFMDLLPKFPVIHLATHAVADDANPLGSFIEFYNPPGNRADSFHRLYEQEIVHLDMRATELVILSACETGNGKLINGEGIISLSRSFSYAGCHSVITSLWTADDSATAFIARQVHKYLLRGDPKDYALQKAKLDYLDDPDVEARYKLPSYWAPLVLVGDFQAVTTKSGAESLIVKGSLILGLLLILISSFLRLKKNRARIRVSAPGTGKVSMDNDL